MYEKVKDILVDEMNIDADDISINAELVNDLGFNSLELADLVVICEEKFDVTIDETELPKLVTVRDVVDYLETEMK